jgi:SP family arabinose:H+ symporter-like MFS transporter
MSMPDNQHRHANLYLIALVATIGAFLFGFDQLIFSGASIFLKKTFDLSANALGFAGASVILGSVLGAVVGGILSDKWGRKNGLVLAGILCAVSAVGTAIPRDMLQFNLFRIVGGAGIGLAMVNAPMYLAEIAPSSMRGPLVTCNQFVMVLGALCAVIIGYIIAEHLKDILHYTVNWRWMFGSELVPVIFLMIGLMFIPESPRWLATQGRHDEALAVLTRLNGNTEAPILLESINQSIREEQDEKGRFRDLLMPGIRMALVIAIGLAVLQHLSGGAALTMYAPIIYQKAGYPDAGKAIGMAVLLNACHLACVVIAIIFVERWGRKPLLITGLSIKAAGHFTLAMFFEQGVIGLPFIVVYFITTCISNISIAPIAWLVMAEIFPNKIRAKGMTVTTFVLFGASYCNIHLFPLVSQYFEDLRGSPSGVFILFGILCIAGVVFIWRVVPETKGKSLEEITHMLMRGQAEK